MIRIMARMAGLGAVLGIAVLAHAHEEGGGHGAHEHGVGQMDVVVDGTKIQIELTSPAANVVGFEHEPRDDKERVALNDAVAALRDGGKLVAFSTAARCVLRDAKILSSLLDEDGHEGVEHGHDQAHEDEHEDEDGHGDHADVFVAWQFECADPRALHEVDARALFTRFPGTERLRIQAVTSRGQSAAELTAAAPKFRF